MNYYNGCGCGICECEVGADRKSPAAFALCRKSCNLMKRNLLKSQLGPVPCCISPMDSSVSQLRAESCRAEIQVWDMCVNKGPGRGHHTQDASLAATEVGRERGLRLRLKQRQPQCIINLAASAHAYILISVYACECEYMCMCLYVSLCVCLAVSIYGYARRADEVSFAHSIIQ